MLGVGGASLTLAGLQLTAPADRVLDVGCGCGIQALRARRVAAHVTATDISRRALAFTELNVLLNGQGGVQTRFGSLFEPVAGETFDRVVSNPPFVITPRVAGVPAYEYRDGGMAGDALVESFVTGVAAVLAPGGVAQLLGNWEYRADADGLERVREWVERAPVPLEAWIVERELLDPLSYAELWVRDGGTTPGSSEYARLIDAWLDDFAARGVTGIGFGYLLLRRPASGTPTLARYERIAQPVPGALGPHLTEALAAWDRLTAMDDVALAASTLTVAPDVTEARHHAPGEEDPRVIELRQGGGFARSLEVDPGLAALVGACDGDLPVGVLIDAIADLLDVDAAALRADLLPRVRELIFTGFLALH
ncbi:MAG TPA: methyltransferase [Micropruina sp.]|nr:methyltransferase [Micropruina sp.]